MQKMVNVEIWTIAQTNQGNAVLLRPLGQEIAVPIFIGQLEIQSILIGREGLSLPRPLTHDLFLNLLNNLRLSLERVEVHELKDNTFHARLVINGENFTEENPLVLDSRPSDAFALAVRRRCPILIASTIIKQAGIPLEFFIEAMEDAAEIDLPLTVENDPLSGIEKRRKLLEQLNQAVEAEEYERAAEIRDMLNQYAGKYKRSDL